MALVSPRANMAGPACAYSDAAGPHWFGRVDAPALFQGRGSERMTCKNQGRRRAGRGASRKSSSTRFGPFRRHDHVAGAKGPIGRKPVGRTRGESIQREEIRGEVLRDLDVACRQLALMYSRMERILRPGGRLVRDMPEPPTIGPPVRTVTARRSRERPKGSVPSRRMHHDGRKEPAKLVNLAEGTFPPRHRDARPPPGARAGADQSSTSCRPSR